MRNVVCGVGCGIPPSNLGGFSPFGVPGGKQTVNVLARMGKTQVRWTCGQGVFASEREKALSIGASESNVVAEDGRSRGGSVLQEVLCKAQTSARTRSPMIQSVFLALEAALE